LLVLLLVSAAIGDENYFKFNEATGAVPPGTVIN
jgi:hypothetical protein